MSKDIESQCDTVLDINDPHFAAKFAEAIGVDPGDTVEFVRPIFDRGDGVIPALSVDDWEGLRRQSPETLRALGCRPWDEPDDEGRVLMLFPAEWFHLIPTGFTVEDINGETEKFDRETSDDDRRFGVLAYGVRVSGEAA